jgi:protocatechuate 3,4-dioxygenase beta subunit
MHHPQDHGHDADLAHDLETLLQRRHALLWLAGVGALPLVACGGGADSTASGTSTSSSGITSSTASTSCSLIPEETNGPYPADGTNGKASGTVDVLTLSGIVRSDIRPNIPASLGADATGVPLTITLTLVNTDASCASLEGCAVYIWHCDSAGRYSLYSDGVTELNYLRGVQATDANGQVSFTTIFPACYAGRMPHVHYEIYKDVNTATSATNALRTAQIAFPSDICNTVYATTAYSRSAVNFAAITFTTDGVFADNVADGTLALETCAITGSVTAGYAATLRVGIAG